MKKKLLQLVVPKKKQPKIRRRDLVDFRLRGGGGTHKPKKGKGAYDRKAEKRAMKKFKNE